MGNCIASQTRKVDRNYTINVPEEDNHGGLNELYEVKLLLGSGAAGDTWLCRDLLHQIQVAVKLVKRPLPPAVAREIIREIKIQAQLGGGHLNIVQPKEAILTRTHLGLVMEYVAGGNMADYILKCVYTKYGGFDECDGLVMDEEEARYYFKQIITAVEYCHRNQVAHRDLKLDNILLTNDSPPRIKLCDFGFSNWWTDSPREMLTITGTPDYMSPQILKSRESHVSYDGTKADIWASGVVLCAMLMARFPFDGGNVEGSEDNLARVLKQQTSFKWDSSPAIKEYVELLTPDCRHLLDSIFEVDEDRRISIAQIKQHPWYTRQLPARYQEGWDRMQLEQRKIEAQVAAGEGHRDRQRHILRELILLASQRWNPTQTESIRRVSAGTLRVQSIEEQLGASSLMELQQLMDLYGMEEGGAVDSSMHRRDLAHIYDQALAGAVVHVPTACATAQ